MVNPALDAKPHHTNLITQKKARTVDSTIFFTMHHNEAALKCITNLDSI